MLLGLVAAGFVALRQTALAARLDQLPLDESDYALAVAELGREVDPPAPYTPGAWLTALAEQLRGR